MMPAMASLSYDESGKGLPVVLLHGFPLDARVWKAQRAALGEQGGRFRVITPDLRGFGKSKSTEPFTIESLADDVHALLKEIGALPCVLGGLSMGGYATLAFANKHPRDLRGLILTDTKAEADTADGKQARDKMIALVREKGSKAVAEQMMPKMLAPDTATTRPAVAQELRAIMEACPPKTIEHALLAMRDRPDRTGELSSIAVPTLIIVGEHDAITPPKVAQDMHKATPKSQLVIVQGAGHMAPMEQPEQVNRALRDFVAKINET
jgi:pimeloyl-ACP methyl ester carboxylesterase